jgi:hypothetical protein
VQGHNIPFSPFFRINAIIKTGIEKHDRIGDVEFFIILLDIQSIPGDLFVLTCAIALAISDSVVAKSSSLKQCSCSSCLTFWSYIRLM